MDNRHYVSLLLLSLVVVASGCVSNSTSSDQDNFDMPSVSFQTQGIYESDGGIRNYFVMDRNVTVTFNVGSNPEEPFTGRVLLHKEGDLFQDSTSGFSTRDIRYNKTYRDYENLILGCELTINSSGSHTCSLNNAVEPHTEYKPVKVTYRPDGTPKRINSDPSFFTFGTYEIGQEIAFEGGSVTVEGFEELGVEDGWQQYEVNTTVQNEGVGLDQAPNGIRAQTQFMGEDLQEFDARATTQETLEGQENTRSGNMELPAEREPQYILISLTADSRAKPIGLATIQ